MWFNKMELDVIKYVGGPNHITILYRNEDSKKLFVFYCYTGKPQVHVEEDCRYTTKDERIISFKTAEINIPISTTRSGVWHQIQIKKESDFDLVESVVTSIMEGEK